MSDTFLKPEPPIAKKVPFKITTHGDERIDNYYWLREKNNPEVLEFLKAENAYTDAILANEKALREQLFQELKARLKEDDSGVPYKDGNYDYYWRMVPGRQYAVHCRKHRGPNAKEEILLDENALAEGKPYFNLGALEVSEDHRWIAYAVDFDGSEKYRIYFKNLVTGELSPEVIDGASTSLEWANDNRTVFYTLLDEHERPDRLMRHVVGENPAKDALIYKEPDPQFFVYCSKSRSRRYIFLDIVGKITSETRFVDADRPTDEFRIIEPRRRGVEYSVSHHSDRFFIVTNDTVQNFRLVEAPVSNPGAANWKEILRGSSELFIESCESFRNHLVVHVREKGLPRLRIYDLKDFSFHTIDFPEPAYAIRSQPNAEFDTEIYRFTYTSLVSPSTVLDYNMRTRDRVVRKVQEIPSGYDPSLYRSERLLAKAADGAEIPISIIYRIDPKTGGLNGSRPLYLYGYGSYGYSVDAAFSTSRISLVDRGFIFAIAHIRGGSELGRHWYEDGKFLKKKNTFSDFITAAEYLIEKGYTRKGEIAIVGGSAGGMLIGAVINERPELFKAAVAHVPFVDVVTTMLDDKLPLTTIEYDEWGNPNDPNYYHYMKSYSPYDNVKTQAYPHLLVTSGLNDPRVTYWEPAKWVAKLREFKTDNNMLLHHINLDAGHGGPSGRYDSLREIALEFAFILKAFGMSEESPRPSFGSGVRESQGLAPEVK